MAGLFRRIHCLAIEERTVSPGEEAIWGLGQISCLLPKPQFSSDGGSIWSQGIHWRSCCCSNRGTLDWPSQRDSEFGRRWNCLWSLVHVVHLTDSGSFRPMSPSSLRIPARVLWCVHWCSLWHHANCRDRFWLAIEVCLVDRSMISTQEEPQHHLIWLEEELIGSR